MFCASGLRNIGIQPLADAIVTYVPSPAERPFAGVERQGRGRRRARPTDTAPLVLWVWKTIADPFAGRITLFRVISGVLKADATVHNVTRDAPERFGHVLVLQGKTQTHVPELHAGDLGAVAKLKDTHTNDTLGDKTAGFTRAADRRSPSRCSPTRSSRRAAATRTRSARRCSGCAKRIRRSATTATRRRTSCCSSGQGQLHIEVTVAKLRRRFGVEVNLKPPRIPYRETITAKVEAHGRHKKQTGGHGQFGDCKIRMEPLPRGADFEFVDDIFGGSIPRQFVPGRRKGHPGHARCAATWPATRSSTSASP